MASELLKTVEQVRFGDGFELDPRAYELRRDGRVLKLERIPMELLLLLVEERGQLVSRDRIIEKVWGKDVFLDTDNSINAAVRKIRQVLKDDSERPHFVQTVTGRGYRFIAPVEEAGTPALERPVASAPARETSLRAKPNWPRLASALALVAVVAVASALGLLRRPGPAPVLRSIAVLPLDNLSGDPSQDYFVDGMTDALTTDLAKVGSMRVISRTSAMRYKGTKKGLPEIARELKVDGVVEGSVVRAGNRLRVTAQLIQAASDQHLWAETYERDLGDVLKLQGEVAQAIAQQVRAQLTPEQEARFRSARSVNPEAYEAYLKGLHSLTTLSSTAQQIRVAQDYFEESIRKDPGFALAYVRLADCYVALGGYRSLSPEVAYGSAKEALRKALELDSRLGEAHTTLATLSWWHDWDWAAAEREFNLAVELAPSYAFGHSSRSGFLAWSGRRAEALAEISKTREIDPGYTSAPCESANDFQLRDYEGLMEVSRRGIVSDPNEWLEPYFLGVAYEALGRRSDAIPEYQKAIELSKGDQDPVAALAHAYAVAGRRTEAETMLRDLQRRSEGYVSPYLIATIYAGLDKKDKAFEMLEKARQERSWDIAWQIKADPRIDNLRSEPRFQSFLRRVGVSQ